MSRRSATGALLVLVLLVPFVVAGCGDDATTEPVGSPAEADAARAAAEHFLDRYVDPDGRVVRIDQGRDTVSEGQAYAMLLAAAIGDRERFDLVWRWTVDNLQRPDGLFAWRWQDGGVVGDAAATDGDLDVARALLLGGDRFDAPGLREHAHDLAAAVLDEETVDVDGLPVLIAGPWEREAPYVFNPSYVSPRTFDVLADATNDPRWDELTATGVGQIRLLTADALPTDLTLVDGGKTVPAAPPGSEPRYGFDAMRVPIRLAEACDPRVRSVAGNLWPLLAERNPEHPADAVALAAAAGAAGHLDERARWLAEAEQLDERHPTYYGAAWLALGRVMLTTDWLGACR